MLTPNMYLDKESAEKDFLRFQEGMIRQDDKYEQLLTFLTGGAFVISTSIVSFFYTSSNKNIISLNILKWGWLFLVVSFLCNAVALNLSSDFHKKYSDLLNSKISQKGFPVVTTLEDLKPLNFMIKRVKFWSNMQIIFWLIGIILLVYFFYSGFN